MEQLNGIVMEQSGRHVILMTTKGEFKRVRIMGRLPEIGEELSIPVAHRRFFSAGKASWMGVAAAVLLVLTASPLINIISSPPDKANPSGTAATGQASTEKAAVQVDSAVLNVADKPEPKVTSPPVQEKLTNSKEQETVNIAKEDVIPSSATTLDTTAVLPNEIQPATKPEPGLTGLTTDRKYINPVNGTGSSGEQSGTTGSQADIGQTAADEDTKNNYMGEEVPGDRETGSGLDSHLQKPNF